MPVSSIKGIEFPIESITTALDLPVGSRFIFSFNYYINMKLLVVLAALVAVAMAGYYHPHAYGHNYHGYYPYYHQYQWPSIRGPGFESTCWGCFAKRSADNEPSHAVAKRSAEPGFYAGYPGVAHHPGGGRSYVGRTVFGYPRTAYPYYAPYHGYYSYY